MHRCIQISHDEVFYYDNVYTDLDELFTPVNRKTNKKWKVEYYNIPVTFDIETSSFYDQDEKRACMYIWMFSIDDQIIIGRSWDEFMYLCDRLVKHFSLHHKFRRMPVYIQNLGFEFQWFCTRFKWKKVFALDTRIPLTALTESGIEFRCSYRLSGYKLEKMGENLIKYKVSKMVGDLDYDKLRLPADPEHGFAGTPLDDKELGYCINDVRVLSAYIREKIETDGNVTKIPLTKTGYVRNYCRSVIYADHESKQFREYRDLMLKLTIEPLEYKILQEGFQGGFVHANAFYVGKTLHDMLSFDYCSKYPSMIVARMFPMGKCELIRIRNREDFDERNRKYLSVFRIRFYGLRSKILFENYLSFSKCRNASRPVINNGRVVSCDYLETTMTNLDFEIMLDCYEWDKIEVGEYYQYKKGYLPTVFIKCVLDFYKLKTELKDVEGKEVEYLQGKENLNSCYGMMVTSVIRDIITYYNDIEDTEDIGWTTRTPILEEVLDKYNTSVNRFLYYPWGVFVTAWSRYDLWKCGILKARDDYVYSDTDSIKLLHPENHQDIIKTFNDNICNDMLKAMRFHKLDPKLISPKTTENVPKPLGVFEIDGRYKRFKTMGAKRYLVDDVKKGIKLTVAGLPKNAGAEYLAKYDNPFKMFKNDMKVPASEAHKQTATYIDYETSGTVRDYMGNYGSYHELTSLHLEAASYEMSLSSEYVDYILDITELEDL